MQNLAGTKPSLRWQVAQPIDGLAVSSISVSAPGFGPNTERLPVGDQLGSGTFLVDIDGSQQGGVGFRVLADGLLLPSNQIGLLQMSVRLRGGADGGLTIEMNSGGLPPRGTNGGMGVALDLFLRPGLVVSPTDRRLSQRQSDFALTPKLARIVFTCQRVSIDLGESMARGRCLVELRNISGPANAYRFTDLSITGELIPPSGAPVRLTEPVTGQLQRLTDGTAEIIWSQKPGTNPPVSSGTVSYTVRVGAVNQSGNIYLTQTLVPSSRLLYATQR